MCNNIHQSSGNLPGRLDPISQEIVANNHVVRLILNDKFHFETLAFKRCIQVQLMMS